MVLNAEHLTPNPGASGDGRRRHRHPAELARGRAKLGFRFMGLGERIYIVKDLGVRVQARG